MLQTPIIQMQPFPWNQLANWISQTGIYVLSWVICLDINCLDVIFCDYMLVNPFPCSCPTPCGELLTHTRPILPWKATNPHPRQPLWMVRLFWEERSLGRRTDPVRLDHWLGGRSPVSSVDHECEDGLPRLFCHRNGWNRQCQSLWLGFEFGKGLDMPKSTKTPQPADMVSTRIPTQLSFSWPTDRPV